MKKTYKSKKDIGTWLDHKDVIFSTDDRNTAFEACYIENIKQTKRELSCVVPTKQYNGVPKRIRKRKYVKRIVKETESRNSETPKKTTYLTPNKSIHVNKVLDPFDLLLNSPSLRVNKASDPFDQLQHSSSSQIKPANTDKEDVFDKILSSVKNKRSYHRRRISDIKKYNYSSSDNTDSDKENSNNNVEITHDTTDIITHKLLIEKKSEPSPDSHDESIKKLVKNISLLNNIKTHRNSSGKRNFESYGNRLTLNNNSPILQQRSPLCSTPFMVKHRGKSMFKLSPIVMGDLCENPKNIPDIVDNKNDSPVCSKSIVKQNLQLSPVSYSSSNNKKNSVTYHKTIVEAEEFSSERISSNIDHLDSDVEKNSITFRQLFNDYKESPQVNPSAAIEMEPCLGFSNNSLQKVKDITPKIYNYKEDNSVIYSLVDDTLPTQPFLGFDIDDKEQIDSERNGGQDSFEKTQTFSSETDSDNASLNSEYEESLYDTCDESSHEEVCEKNIKIPLVKIVKISDALFKEYFDRLPNYEHSIDQYDDIVEDNTNNSNNIVCTQNIYTSDNISEKSLLSIEAHISTAINNLEQSEPIDSNYEHSIDHFDDNYSTDNISEKSINIQKEDVSVETNNVDKSDTIDLNYEYSIAQYDDIIENNISNRSNDNKNILCMHNVNSSDNISEKSIHSLEADISTETSNIGKSDTIDSINTSEVVLSSEECSDSNSNNEESKTNTPSISFVTIRRPRKVFNDSEFIYDNSYQSISTASPSTESDNTVLSVTKMNITEKSSPALHTSHHRFNIKNKDTTKDETLDIENEINSVTHKTDHSYNKDTSEDKLDILPELKPSTITTRKNSRIRKSVISTPEIPVEPTSSQMRPPIVLQPGKKWERSLSIYKRFTMVDHFDKSILKDEPLENKGRKYRQSIISTMEMQENDDLLHNESINSRRSTIVSKPSRSTIKIVIEPNSSRTSLCTTTAFEDLKGFLSEDCDDTVLDLSRLSIADIEHEVTVLEKVHDTSSRTPTAQDYVLRRCNQTEPLLFDECYPDTVLKNCRKIGEGVYGEVFLWRASDGRARVMKIVPIAGATRVNGEQQKDFHEIISEIVIAMELSALRAPIASIERHFDEDAKETLDLHTIENATDVFNEVLAVRCVYGTYPSRLLDLWELYDETKGSENDNPTVLPRDQQYIVLELANAGEDLESYQFNSAEQAHALFIQVAYGLAVAEEAFQFEHRDLHWGNVLIAPTDQKFATFVLRGRSHRVPRCGVAATIIDYSLSRVSLPLGGSGAAGGGGETAALYNDLATDDGLFDAVGDYQFDVYRLMRDKLGNDWKNFEPYTNILWLHYTVDKMITALRYKRTNTKIHKHYIAKLKGIKNRILEYGSAAHFVLTDNEY